VPVSRIVLAVLLLLPAPVACARAATLEEVSLLRVGYDDATIERADGTRYRLDLRGCHADLRPFAGRSALLWCPVPGPSVDSRLLVPDFDLNCAVVDVDTLERARQPRGRSEAPEQGLLAMRQALELLGWDCGPPGGGWGRDAGIAFLRFRQSKQLDATDQGTRRAITSLALDVLRGRQPSGTGLRLSRIISVQLDELARWLSPAGPGGTACTESAWIRSVSGDGALVSLSDGTGWRPLRDGAERTARWAAGEQVTVCAGRMIYWPSGEMIGVGAVN
jgi:hypothetical protein